ncbi:hypothetical protein Taro_003179 [Colocasia esculenta]|uniref:Uncharacterized protein n=1 Tax=Colocasia esculenta TaxID=4460 RepID=A0A843TJ37_COLES|nr:hypothetical protein [Colocasia esculenta]
MASWMQLWSFWFILRRFIHPGLRDVYDRMTLKLKFMFLGVHAMDKMNLWHRLPTLLGLLYLEARRTLHQKYNLINVGKVETTSFKPDEYPYRTSDGRFNDPTNSEAGRQMSFIGSNNPPVEHKDQMEDPDPYVVVQKLLERREFKDTGKQLNVIAAAWIQFMIHGWINDHMEDTTKLFPHKKQEGSRQATERDGSVIYGNNRDDEMRLRTGSGGKLNIQDNNLLSCDEDGKLASGDVRNSWIGVSLLQALFVKEHNAVCDALKEAYPQLESDDKKLYQHAKLVTSAVMAKIHTIDWTVELLKTRTMRTAMLANWYGLLGKKFKSKFGHVGGSTLGPVFGGLVGMKQAQNHGVPFSLTEDFACVYRMHSLLPDELKVVDINKPPSSAKETPEPSDIKMEELVGIKGERFSREKVMGFETQLVSMGYQASGALLLWNYPSFLRDLIVQDEHGRDRGGHVDLPVLEVYRDRERSVPRYNQFRRSLMMIPISNWKDLTNDEKTIDTLKEVYGEDVEKLDLLVGLMAEKKIKGFAISETAFFVFVLMASRRLEADRFFTSDFNEKIYTKRGFEWVNNTETLRDVIQRHFPDVAEK